MQKFNSIEELNNYYIQLFTQAAGFKQFTMDGFFKMEHRKLKKLYKQDFKLFYKYHKKLWREEKVPLNVEVKQRYKKVKKEYKPNVFIRLGRVLKQKKKNRLGGDVALLERPASKTAPQGDIIAHARQPDGAEEKAAPGSGKATSARSKTESKTQNKGG